jgi:hypothetical protein
MSSAATGASTASFIPNLENHFGVYFDQNVDSSPISSDSSLIPTEKFDPFNWSNPYNPRFTVIHPFTFEDNEDLIEECKKVYAQNCQSGKLISDSGALVTLHQDAFNRVFVFLEPKDLVNFSAVSKCCYLATKVDIIWVIQLQNCFPNINPLPTKVCSLSPEHQFKIYFKKVNDEKKPYNAQITRNNDVTLHLRGPTGFDGAIDIAWKQCQAFGGEAAVQHYYHERTNAIARLEEGVGGSSALEDDNPLWTPEQRAAWNEEYDALKNSDAGKAAHAYQEHQRLQWLLIRVQGNTYNGSTASIDSNSQQARCAYAIHEIPELFNDQEKFEAFIQQAEAAKNNSAQSNEVASPQDPFQPWVDSDSNPFSDTQ